MKIKYITEDGIITLRKNAKDVFKEVVRDKSKTINDLLNDNNLIKESSFEVEDYSLEMQSPNQKPSLTDMENVQRVYNHMKGLSDSQASDERIWVAYSLSEQLDYMRFRWPCEDEKDMLNRYFFNYSKNRSLFRNGISRLWWIGRVTYDKYRSDPYELTKFILQEQDYVESICGRFVFNNPVIEKAVLEAMLEASKKGIQLDRYIVRNIAKYINLLSGSYIVDMMNPEVIFHKVSEGIEQGKFI